MMNRMEHVQMCKDRAEEYLKRGDFVNAWGSFVSDLQNREETKNHLAIAIGLQFQMMGKLNDVTSMRRFIQGFN